MDGFNSELDFTSGDSLKPPLKILLKVPKKERYNVLLINPHEEPSSHLYGKWKQTQIHRKVRLPIDFDGKWLVKLQLLESGVKYDVWLIN